MNDSNQPDTETLRQKLNRDTARVNWTLLDRYRQEDSVIEVTSSLDLVDVACAFVDDNSTQVAAWLEESAISKVSNEQAQLWQDEDREIWAVVVAPWILVQQQKPSQ